jgi:hypothetical protein
VPLKGVRKENLPMSRTKPKKLKKQFFKTVEIFPHLPMSGTGPSKKEIDKRN